MRGWAPSLLPLLLACCTAWPTCEPSEPLAVPPLLPVPARPHPVAKPEPPPTATPAKLASRYASLTEAARDAMTADPPLPASTLQHILDLDEHVKETMALVMRDEGRRAGPQAIQAAQDALHALSTYLATVIK